MPQEENIKDRIEQLIEALGISSRKFSLSVSTSDSFARNIKDSIGSDKIRNILREYPQVNLYWLIDGQGEMFRDNSINNNVGNSNNISGSNILGSGSIDSSINVAPPEGYSKIIKPDRTIVIQRTEPTAKESQLEELRNTISVMQETIEAQKLVIELLKSKI